MFIINIGIELETDKNYIDAWINAKGAMQRRYDYVRDSLERDICKKYEINITKNVVTSKIIFANKQELADFLVNYLTLGEDRFEHWTRKDFRVTEEK